MLGPGPIIVPPRDTPRNNYKRDHELPGLVPVAVVTIMTNVPLVDLNTPGVTIVPRVRLNVRKWFQ